MTEPSDSRGRGPDEPPTPPPPPAYPPMPGSPPGPGASWWQRLTGRQRLLLFGGVGVLVLALVAGTLLTVSGTIGSDDGKAVAKRNLQPFRQAVEELGAAQGLTYQDTSAFGVTENQITATAGGSKYGTTSSGGKRLEQGLLNVDGKTFMRWSEDPAPPPGAESGKPGKWMADHADKDSLVQEALRRTLPPPQLAEVLTQALDALEKAPPTAERPDEKPRSVHGEPALAIDTSAGRLLVTRRKPHQVLRLEPYDFHEFAERLKEGEAPETIPEVTRGPLTVGSPEGMDITPVLGDAVDAMFDTLLGHTKQLKNAGDRGINFTIDGSGDMNCSSSGCSVTQKFTGEVTSKARDERVSKGKVSAVLTATFSIGGQSAGQCTSPRSTFRLTGNNAAGTLRCSNPGAGSVYSSVAARYKARAEAQSRASGGRVVHYSIPLRASTLVEASALAAVEVKALVDRVNGERRIADCATPHSFPSGTRVLLADGTHRPIEDIRTGYEVRSPAGASLRVTGVLDQQGRQRTHDLTVDGLHTYYVLAGETPVLVHNSNCSTGAGRDLIDGQAQLHIIHGDRTGGGHKWPGQAGKTVFPPGWDTERILNSVAEVATSPKSVWTQQTGKKGALYTKNLDPSRWKIEGNVDGVKIRVIYEPATDRIVTGFPYR
ncbi:EndoU domain-containing protein [Streptomyces sp. NPDC094045]|uniref:EndoU domain-containing protein n=1 Tax=Streptomyces sp. NPDC094045 TaxID=3161019 RepID=UPI003396F90B